MTRSSLIILLLVLVTSSTGCSSLAWPQLPQSNLYDPIGRQQELNYLRQRAQRYDPYPEPGVGPSVESVRPPGYKKAPPEPSRARWHIRDQLAP